MDGTGPSERGVNRDGRVIRIHPTTSYTEGHEGEYASTNISRLMCLGLSSARKKGVDFKQPAPVGESTVDYCSRTAYGSCYGSH